MPLLAQEKELAERAVKTFCISSKGETFIPEVTLIGGLHNGSFLPINNENEYDTYIFNIGSDDGFVIVSGTSNNIIGYSKSGHVDLANIPDNFKNSLEKVSKNTKRNNLLYANKPLDEAVTYNDNDTIKFPNEVLPLLGEIEWGQSFPYNMYCPVINDTICPTGCVATAMAQVLGYWKRPDKGIGAKTYTCNNVGEISVEFSQTTYDWANICDQYSSISSEAQNKAIAELMYHCGVAMEMKYNTKGSSPSGISYVEDAYRNHFGFSNMHIIENKYFSDKTWIKFLKTELENGRPIEYSGKDTIQNAAHAFVLDGYDENNLFHVNWGWSGLYNCYFRLDALEPSTQNYSSDSWATTQTIPNDYIEGFCEKMYFPVAQSMSSSNTSAKLGGKISVTIYKVINAGNDTLIGKAGLGLYKANGTLVSSAYYWDFSKLKRQQNLYSSLEHTFTIPTNLENGLYYIRAIFKPSDNDSDIFLHGLYGQPNYLCVEVKDGTASIYSPQKESINLKVDTIAYRGENLCRNFNGEFTLKITNTENAAQYHSYIGLLLVNENDSSEKYLISKNYVEISPLETQTLTFTDTIHANTGTYKLYVMYDTDNLPIDCEDLYSIGSSIDAEVIDVERAELVVTQEFAVENKDNVPKDNIQVHDIHVKNIGTPLKGYVKAGVYDQTIEKWVGVFDEQEIDMANGEEAILSFQSPYMNLDNGEYMIFVLYGGFDTHTYCAYSAGNGVKHYARFTLTDASEISTILNDYQSFDVYTLSGERILSGIDAKNIKSVLKSGVYIIVSGTKVRKILVR